MRGMNESTRPIVIYRNRDGSFKRGFVMRADEFIASLALLKEARTAAGLPIDEQRCNTL